MAHTRSKQCLSPPWNALTHASGWASSTGHAAALPHSSCSRSRVRAKTSSFKTTCDILGGRREGGKVCVCGGGARRGEGGRGRGGRRGAGGQEGGRRGAGGGGQEGGGRGGEGGGLRYPPIPISAPTSELT